MSGRQSSGWDWFVLLMGLVFLLIGVVAVADAVSGAEVRIARVLSGSFCVVLGAGTLWRWARHRREDGPSR
ncbi:hypothetical protein ACFWNN_28015 [Lentzea sp. NPDC058450]|uniref:hypothetical protein n=1 Tax=Lentzea sp. NPDC058450 TaxID=3346505 RepID=UPI00365E59E7